MITSVQLQNFKSFQNQRIPLERLTVLVGANASGKTSVLDAIWIAVQATLNGQTQISGLANVRALNRPGWELDSLYTRGAAGQLFIQCNSNIRPIGFFADPPVLHDVGRSKWTIKIDKPTLVDPDERPLQNYGVPTPEYLKLNATKLSIATYADQFPPRMATDGEGLPSVLADMALGNRVEFDGLIEEMRRLIPHFMGIRFTKRLVQRIETELVRFGDDTVERQINRDFQGDAILFDFQNAKGISAHLVSEGTLMLLGLLTILLGPSRPDLLLLDDIEHGLHPLAQKSLLEFLRKIMERFPNLQVVATAHSPYLLDYLKSEEVRLLTIDPDGYSVCGKLTDHPQFEKWKGEMAPGEMWSLFGEKWLGEGHVQ
ncbi:MAG: AAA family ATPase [Planctomycetes bacterium]|nr:AAA family ATPase [Planctomycetota bacterium]